ncbi:flagellar protein FliT [Nitrosococcus watsonii]|uniref:Flagellar protein FliT n=1 Tax=Nitrosococcus watsoni (strain C-113) TaxID=105559 RepID=D8K8C1_NITWC|nr:flagellar protein FliT [Nitrosococcus watsonii]ADJ29041.1 conserved hypothetical protein [Nitrosococcus watsonii C-113]
MSFSAVTEHPIFEPEAVKGALDELLVLSQKMLLKAQESAWRELAELQAERDGLLQHSFSREQILVMLPSARQRLERLLSLNEEIAALCQLERNRFSQEIKKLHQGSQARDIYRAYNF